MLAGIRCQGLRGLPLDMSRIHPECPDSGPSDRLVVADVLLRQEPDEEEEEEEEEGKRKRKTKTTTATRSERVPLSISVGEG